MERIPIMRIDNCLMVSIQVELYDELVAQLQVDILDIIDQKPARGVVIDVSGLELLDTFTSRALARTATMTGLMGAETIITGMRAEIAMTLIEMGFSGSTLHTERDIDTALAYLRGGTNF